MLTSLGVSFEAVHAGKWYLGNQDHLELEGCWHSSLHAGDGEEKVRSLSAY